MLLMPATLLMAPLAMFDRCLYCCLRQLMLSTYVILSAPFSVAPFSLPIFFDADFIYDVIDYAFAISISPQAPAISIEGFLHDTPRFACHLIATILLLHCHIITRDALPLRAAALWRALRDAGAPRYAIRTVMLMELPAALRRHGI